MERRKRQKSITRHCKKRGWFLSKRWVPKSRLLWTPKHSITATVQGLDEDVKKSLAPGVFTKNYITIVFLPQPRLYLSSLSVLQQINLDCADGFMLALCLKLSPDEAVVWRWPLQLIPKQFPLSSVIGDTWEQILELVSSPTAEVSTSARVGCTRMLGQGYADKQYTEGSTLQASRTCPRDVPCWRREGCRMKISALEVVGKFTGVSSHGVIVMKRWVHGSWCRGTKGLLEHMATVANYPQPLQNLHFLEVQWMWVASLWVLESVGGSSVRNILQKINKSLGKFVLSDPLATRLTVLSCRESSESHLSSSGSFALHLW